MSTTTLPTVQPTKNRLAAKVWGIAHLRKMIITNLPREDLFRCLCVSWLTFEDAVEQLYKEWSFCQHDLFLMGQNPISLRFCGSHWRRWHRSKQHRRAVYMGAVRHLHYCEYEAGEDMVYYDLTDLFPNITWIEDDSFRLNVDFSTGTIVSLTRRYQSCHDHSKLEAPRWLPPEEKTTHFSLVIGGWSAVYQHQSQLGIESEDKILLSKNLDTLDVIGDLEAKRVLRILQVRNKITLTGPTNLSLYNLDYGHKDINTIREICGSTLTSLSVRHGSKLNFHIGDLWTSITWPNFSNLRNLRLDVKVDDSVKYSRATWEKGVPRYEGQTGLPLNLDVLTIRLLVNNTGLIDDPTKLLETLPPVSILAEILLSVGGRLCGYGIQIRLSKLEVDRNDQEDDTPSTVSEPKIPFKSIKATYIAAVKREIRFQLSRPSVSKGWMKVENYR